MPNGRTHRNLTYTLGTLILPTVCVMPLPVSVGLLVGIGLSIYINPDNDIHCKWWLKPFGYELYRQVITHRRGLNKKHYRKFKWWELFLASHLPYTGTLLRFIPVLVFLIIGAMSINLDPYTTAVFILAVYNGLGLSDTVHVLADIITSEVHQWET